MENQPKIALYKSKCKKKNTATSALDKEGARRGVLFFCLSTTKKMFLSF